MLDGLKRLRDFRSSCLVLGFIILSGLSSNRGISDECTYRDYKTFNYPDQLFPTDAAAPGTPIANLSRCFFDARGKIRLVQGYSGGQVSTRTDYCYKDGELRAVVRSQLKSDGYRVVSLCLVHEKFEKRRIYTRCADVYCWSTDLSIKRESIQENALEFSYSLEKRYELVDGGNVRVTRRTLGLGGRLEEAYEKILNSSGEILSYVLSYYDDEGECTSEIRFRKEGDNKTIRIELDGGGNIIKKEEKEGLIGYDHETEWILPRFENDEMEESRDSIHNKKEPPPAPQTQVDK